jgi:polar amino acid transport system substrate-binding protein
MTSAIGVSSLRLRPAVAAFLGVLALSLAATAEAQTLTRIKDSATLRIGHRADARPFSYVDDAGQPAGYVVEMCQAVAEGLRQQLGLPEIKIEYLEVGTEERFQAVAEGRIDLLCGSSTVTLSRREIVSFSLPTFITGVSAALRADASSFLKEVLAGRRPTSAPRTLVVEAFRDRVFGVRAGTTAEAWLERNLESLAVSARLVKVDDYAKGLEMTARGEIDAFFGDRAILLELIVQGQNAGFLELGERHLTYEPYALALTRGDEDFRLAVDRELSRLYGSGAIDPLFIKYFGRPNESVRTLFLLSSLPE